MRWAGRLSEDFVSLVFDVAVVGGGPAGASCAALCAAAGQRVLLLERTTFPREKVCGDCLNPACWSVLERLDLRERLLALPHSRLEAVEFIGIHGRPLRVPIPREPFGEVAVRRSHLDLLLVTRAAELGAEVVQNATVTALRRGWEIECGAGNFRAKTLVGADGRNSTVARLLDLLPAAHKDRVAIQTHFPAPKGFGEKVVMRLLVQGYCGAASVGEGLLNLCLVSRPQSLAAIKDWATAHFSLPDDQPWRSIAPLARRPVSAAHENLLLIGDAARVVEPFTGEGIYYALASGALAADHLQRATLDEFRATHAKLYRGRLWINQLAKAAVLHPVLGSFLLSLGHLYPGAMKRLTSKVVEVQSVR